MMVSVRSLKAEGEKKKEASWNFHANTWFLAVRKTKKQKKSFLRIFSDKLNINKPEPDYGKDTHFFPDALQVLNNI